ncbi:hypothetical protein BS47DRAFT_1343464, partial [Hydnum rufescens UP504]
MLNVQSYVGTFTIARIGTLHATLPSRRRQLSLVIRSIEFGRLQVWVAVARELFRPYRRSEIRISGESNPFSFTFVPSVSSRASRAIDSTTKTRIAPCYIRVSLHSRKALLFLSLGLTTMGRTVQENALRAYLISIARTIVSLWSHDGTGVFNLGVIDGNVYLLSQSKRCNSTVTEVRAAN